jgi:hypothetical protein
MNRLLSAVLFIFITLCTFNILYSQPWVFDFGSTTGSYSTPSGVSTTFLPAATSGTSRIRMSGTGGGSFNLENNPIPMGENVYLRIAAPTTASINVFSIYDYTPGKTFTLKFNIRFGASDGSGTGAASGTWYLFIGDGATYSGNGGFAGAQVFTGLRFVFGASGIVTTSYRSSGTWIATGLIGTPFAQGITYSVEIYGNNSTTTQFYNYGSVQSLAPDKWDLWIDNALIGDDLGKALLLNDLNIDSWMIYGESSTGNVANIFLDEFCYQNSVAGDPLPVSLNYFNAFSKNRNVDLKWETSQEVNNSGFDIERRKEHTTGGQFSAWEKIIFIPGHGTSNESHTYRYSDNKLNTGKYEYRLKQIDNNGMFEYFNLSNPSQVIIGSPFAADISQNYPNPSNPKCKIDYQLPEVSKVSIRVYDMTGREVVTLVNEVKDKGYYTAEFDGTNLASGVYFYRIITDGADQNFSKTVKMILVK